MADVFISYAREDRAFAERLASALRQNHISVWWDWDLIGGANYRIKIREAIVEAKKVLVLWSTCSINSAFVLDEASYAKKLGKLIPLSIDGSEPPFGFGDLHTIELENAVGSNVAPIIAAIEDDSGLQSPFTAPNKYRRRLVLGASSSVVVLSLGGLAYTLWQTNTLSNPNYSGISSHSVGHGQQ
jgi:hypothetical protein